MSPMTFRWHLSAVYSRKGRRERFQGGQQCPRALAGRPPSPVGIPRLRVRAHAPTRPSAARTGQGVLSGRAATHVRTGARPRQGRTVPWGRKVRKAAEEVNTEVWQFRRERHGPQALLGPNRRDEKGANKVFPCPLARPRLTTTTCRLGSRTSTEAASGRTRRSRVNGQRWDRNDWS